MKALLDEMFPAWIAEQLRQHGHAVVAVLEREDMAGTPDHHVFAAAQRERHAVITENVRDFRMLASDIVAAGGVHHALILTTDRRFPRGRRETAGRLLTALAALVALLETMPSDEPPSSRELWL